MDFKGKKFKTRILENNGQYFAFVNRNPQIRVYSVTQTKDGRIRVKYAKKVGRVKNIDLIRKERSRRGVRYRKNTPTPNK